MRYRTSILLATLVAGCATASSPPGGDTDARPDAKPFGGRIDAAPLPDTPPGAPDANVDATPPPDARPAPDAMPGTATLNQTTSQSVANSNSEACNLNNVTGENSYYRVFRLSDYGINTAFTINKVNLGVESAVAGNGSGKQQVQLKLYTYTGTVGQTNLDTTKMTLLGQTLVNVNDTNPNETSGGTVVPVSISATAPAGSTIAVEVFVQDATSTGTNSGNIFFYGSNTSGETASGYIRTGADCGLTTPTSLDSLYTNGSLPTPMDIVLTVTGTYN